MKKIRFLQIFTSLLLIISIFFACSNQQTNENKKQEEFAPQPLVIEETEHIKTGAYTGRIILNGDGISDTEYEGVFFILIEDDKATVVATDFIREKYRDMYIGESKDD